ncbi:MAG: hypothetical protein ATN33_03035 [Epulopiscium sp. Nele67-Bin001]|nr:MAG: hypothetical protein ATN33_03035 [Epulopiscium sp. Nele67-Bin001]
MSSLSKHINKKHDQACLLKHLFDCNPLVYLVKKLFARCAGQDGKLQFSIHGCDSDIYLPEKAHTETREEKSPAVHSSVSLDKHQGVMQSNNWVKKNCNHFVCSWKQLGGSLTAK